MTQHYCHRCGLRLADSHAGCPRCGQPRREVLPPDPAYVPAFGDGSEAGNHSSTGRRRFKWVWSHFFRNGCLMAAGVSLMAAIFKADRHNEQAGYVAGTLLMLFAGVVFHLYYLVATRSPARR